MMVEKKIEDEELRMEFPRRAPVSIFLSSILILALLGFSARAQLLHRYDFETAGSASDTVGTAHGTIRGTATVSGGALNTTGAAGGLSGGVPQNCVSLPASAVAGITGAFGIEIWFTANYNGPWCTLFSFSANNTANYVLVTTATAFSPNPSRVEVVGGGGSGAYQQANQIYTDTATLHQMLVIYDGTNVTYFLDGALSTFTNLPNSFTDTGLNLSSLTYIGIAGGSPYADNTIKGKVYDFRIYGQALTLNQAAAIYGLGTNASNASISNALVTAQQSTVPFDGNWVRMPFYGNVGLHDPGIIVKEGNSYFVYGDGTGNPGNVSTDLRNWSGTSAVFPSGPPAWTTNSIPGGSPNYFWAPDTAYFNGLWHMYYSYSEWGTRNSVIGLATSPSLTNAVWTDQGKVVKSYYPATADTDTASYNCIDPSICVATNGTVWMAYGSYSSGILVTQLDPATGLRLNTNSIGTKVSSNAGGSGEGNTEEGSCIFQRGGLWYLFVNWGGCCSGTYSTYNIRVGRSLSPTGPYYDKNGVNLLNNGGTMFMESTARYIGPGHPAILNDNGTNWFTYHFYDGLANGAATVGMNQLYWTADGWPVLTNDWSAQYPLAGNANETSATYNGSLQGGAAFSNDPARGSVLNLNGTSAYVSLPRSVGNASTFAAWVKWNGGATGQRIFDFGNDTNNYFYLTPSSGGGTMRFAIKAGGGEQQINAAFALPTNSWHHLAVTLDGSRGILYYDGAPVATNNSLTIRPWQTTPHTNYLGRSKFATDPFFTGQLSSFRSYGRALSAAEIGDIYSAYPSLAHRYSFSTNGPSAVWDSIGMAHGTLKGNAAVTNNALKLTGASGGYANLPAGLVSGCSSVTLEFWATFGVNGNWARVFDTGNINGSLADHYYFFSPRNGSSGQRMELNTSSTRTFDITGTLDNRTVHVAAICDPANSYMAVYTNGVLEAQLTASMPALTGVASISSANSWSFIGRSLFGSDAYLNAMIDELRLYAGRLTSQQIAADYLAGPDALVLPAPGVPGGLSATAGDGVVSLSWNFTTNATGYNVKRSFVSGGPYTTIATNVPGLNYTNTGLANGTLYYYVVSATNAATGLESSNSVQVSAGPTWAIPPNIAERIYALTTDNQLLAFDSIAPGNILSAYTVSGLQANEKIVGIDFWNGALYGLGDQSRLYTINRNNGAAGLVGSFTPVLNGQAFGFDAEPGGLRVVSDLDQNLLLDYGTGAATVGATINGSPNPALTGLAYHSGNAQRYVADYSQNTIGLLNVASGLVTTLGPAGIDFSRHNGFDISGNPGTTAYLVSPAASSDLAANLYKVDLTTGAATLVGLIGLSGDNILLRGLAVGPGYVNLSPTALTMGATGDQLTLSWPVDHTGWRLQTQTNATTVGLGTNWFDVVGAAATNAVTVPVETNNDSVFYRLIYP